MGSGDPVHTGSALQQCHPRAVASTSSRAVGSSVRLEHNKVDAFVAGLLDTLKHSLQGRYVVSREIGHGGMAVVYLAQDVRHDRPVAIKVLEPDLAILLGTERFLREIRVAARLHHPHLLPLYDSGEVDGSLFYVGPYIEAGSLRDRLHREGALPQRLALRLVRESAEALDYAHRNNVVHRDIKPENLLLEDDHALVADFGIARAISAAAQDRAAVALTQAGLLVGTPSYMSPEQANGEALDGRADVYSLGCVLFELITGRQAFPGSTPLEILAKRWSAPLPTLQSAGIAAPAVLEALVERAIAKLPADRFQTAREFADALSLAEASLARSDGAPTRVAAIGTTGPVLTPAASMTPTKVSLAVLPFVNLSADRENEYFSDGLTEELINVFAKMQGLRVAARTSAFAFKGKEVDVREIGQRLNVTTVLEGSVRRAGNRLRITAQLISTVDGYHLWSETYDREVADVFAVQDELSRAIAGALKLRLVERAAPTDDLEAYTLYLRGRYFWNRRTVEGYRHGIEQFEAALRRDPNYALAHAGIADCYSMLAFDHYGGMPPRDGMPKAKAAAERALELDGSLAEANTTLAVIALLFDWDWAGAERRFRAATQLNRNYAQAYHWMSHLLSTRQRHEESYRAIHRALELDPMSLILHQNLGRALHFAGRHAEAAAQLEKTVEMDPAFASTYEALSRPLCSLGRLEEAEALIRTGIEKGGPWAMLVSSLGYVAGLRGDRAEALRCLAELEDQQQRVYVPATHLACIHLGLNDIDACARELVRMQAQHSSIIPWLKVDPRWTPLHAHPGFSHLMEHANV
jgi:eukaryotic-like serine/threonine-protein kinase